MRSPPKPFTVEIKKSRRHAAKHPSLFGELLTVTEIPAPPVVNNAERLGAVTNKAPITKGRGEGASVTDRQPCRILPDLTAKPTHSVVSKEEPPKRRKARSPKPRKQKATAKKPAAARQAKGKSLAPVTVRPPSSLPSQPMPTIRVRRRPKDPTGLGPGERWRRRLPPFAR